MYTAAWRRSMAREWLRSNHLTAEDCRRFHVDRRRLVELMARAEPDLIDWDEIREAMEGEDG